MLIYDVYNLLLITTTKIFHDFIVAFSFSNRRQESDSKGRGSCDRKFHCKRAETTNKKRVRSKKKKEKQNKEKIEVYLKKKKNRVSQSDTQSAGKEPNKVYSFILRSQRGS